MSKKAKAFSLLIIIVLIVSGTGFLAALVFKPLVLDDGSRDRNIITKLQNEGYIFVLPRDYFAGTHYPKTALLIHDVDFAVQGAPVFERIERSLGVKSAFYLRPDTEWYQNNLAYFQKLATQGWEIGYQYDCLSRSDGNQTLAMQLFKTQLSSMRSCFNVSTTDYHGDDYNLTIVNFDLYLSNKQDWSKLSLNEVYSLNNYSYVTDSNNVFIEPARFGELVVVQLHTDWTK
jgi:hypothetical protein